MAVFLHAFRCELSADSCSDVIRAWRLGQRGETRSLSADAMARYEKLQDRRDLLAAFGLEDPDYAKSWLSPDTISPSLAALLTLMPGLERLGGADDPHPGLFDLTYGRRVLPGAPRRLVRKALAGPAVGEWLGRIAGPLPEPGRPGPHHIGRWARGRSARRLLHVMNSSPEGVSPSVDDASLWRELLELLRKVDGADWVVTNVIC